MSSQSFEPSLASALGDATDELVRRSVALVDQELRAAEGVTGVTLRAGRALLEKAKPGFLERVMLRLWPDLARALDPFYQEAVRSGAPLTDAFRSRAGEVAEAIVGVADAHAERTESDVVKGTYAKLRGPARRQIESAAPKLGELVQGYVVA